MPNDVLFQLNCVNILEDLILKTSNISNNVLKQSSESFGKTSENFCKTHTKKSKREYLSVDDDKFRFNVKYDKQRSGKLFG